MYIYSDTRIHSNNQGEGFIHVLQILQQYMYYYETFKYLNQMKILCHLVHKFVIY